jgi:hypothetical protein
MMSYGPYDLRLVEALAEQRLAAVHRVRIGLAGRSRVRGVPPERSDGRGRIALRRPAHGAAGGT